MGSSESRFCSRLGFAVKAKARFFETTTGVGHQKPDYTVAKKAGRTFGFFPHELMEWSELSESLSNLPLEINMLPLYGK